MHLVYIDIENWHVAEEQKGKTNPPQVVILNIAAINKESKYASIVNFHASELVNGQYPVLGCLSFISDNRSDGITWFRSSAIISAIISLTSLGYIVTLDVQNLQGISCREMIVCLRFIRKKKKQVGLVMCLIENSSLSIRYHPVVQEGVYRDSPWIFQPSP